MAKASEASKELAYMLYMSGTKLKEIQERCGIGSPNTLNRWIKDGNWKDKRAASTITRTELVNKTLGRINDLLDDEKFNPDSFAKLASAIEKLGGQNNVVMVMDVFINFTSWLHQQATIDQELSIDIIKMFNKYQDAYIGNKLAGNE